MFTEDELVSFQNFLSLNLSFSGESILFLLSAVGMIGFYGAFLALPKLSAQRSLFWKAFLAHFVVSLLRYAGGLFFTISNRETIIAMTDPKSNMLKFCYPKAYTIIYWIFISPPFSALDLNIPWQFLKAFYYFLFYEAT